MRFHVMAKPIGPRCNLRCRYCYYLHKDELFADERDWRMSDAMLERFIRLHIAAQDSDEINFSWQGGEPTLLGLEFFEKVIKLQKIYCPPTKRIANDLQTNGTLLDDDWCEFLRKNKFLVGLSVDGPRELHDVYRVDIKGQGTLDRVIKAAELMNKHRVEFNTLTVVNRCNAKKPLDVYRFLCDEIGSRYLQFIPCVEPVGFASIAPQCWDKDAMPTLGDDSARPGGENSVVTDWSVDPDEYGDFLCSIFDQWVRNDVGKIFVLSFDCALGQWLGMPASACCFAEVCGKAAAMEHDGSVYACDHYVYPEYKLGNIEEKSLSEMLCSDKQVRFGLDKTDTLPRYCRDCEVRFACNGECPKNRFLYTPEGEFGLNYLCSGLRKFFNHIDPWMKIMADELQAGRTADGVMKIANKEKAEITIASMPRPKAKLNAKCPCQSGKKYKKCCYAKDMQVKK